MLGTIVEFADLQRLSGFERRSDVERWAQQISLPVRPCQAGVWTTLEALNQSLGVRTRTEAKAAQNAPYSLDIL